MEKTHKGKNITLKKIKRNIIDTDYSPTKSKIKHRILSDNEKGGNNNNLIALSKSTLKKKSMIAQEFLFQMQSTKKNALPRNNSIENKYDEQKSTERLNKRNNSLIDIMKTEET